MQHFTMITNPPALQTKIYMQNMFFGLFNSDNTPSIIDIHSTKPEIVSTIIIYIRCPYSSVCL